MSFESVGIALALVVITALWVFSPVLNRGLRGRGASAAVQQHERLTAQYERILTGIRDLDEDYSMGKIGLAAYEAEREKWTAQGVALLMALDEVAPSVDVPVRDVTLDGSLDAQIERAIAARRREMAGEEHEAKVR